MMDRKIDRKSKEKALNSCVVSDINYGLDTLALSKLQQHTLQVSENNWNKRTTGVKRLERRITTDRREEVGPNACIVGRMKWAGRMARTKDERLPKRSEA